MKNIFSFLVLLFCVDVAFTQNNEAVAEPLDPAIVSIQSLDQCRDTTKSYCWVIVPHRPPTKFEVGSVQSFALNYPERSKELSVFRERIQQIDPSAVVEVAHEVYAPERDMPGYIPYIMVATDLLVSKQDVVAWLR